MSSTIASSTRTTVAFTPEMASTIAKHRARRRIDDVSPSSTGRWRIGAGAISFCAAARVKCVGAMVRGPLTMKCCTAKR